ncbi:glycoside hydrolase family 76 protein [Stigmatella aurantiaca]|uniref:Glycoside hydrolase, family 76 n=3 Tax=Stigmatella aurantiaca (strain DW4/3-1) TaxID=378806 RepID=E3FC92_STIAD|nr:glycoside hydrolase family 76 protein [Stigmatella aurantiaca]ADO70015.1 Glycoside hydrolase, family 76 [Stigmatella aurantiaca DW4/3-1]
MNWRLLTLLVVPLALAYAPGAIALTPTEKNLAFDSYNNAFYVANGGNGYYVVDTNRGAPGRFHFWKVCEQIEAAEDAYDRTGNPAYRTLVASLLNGLNNVISGTTDFASWNEYNDDVMWAVIALTRGYEITGNRAFLDQAQWQFNKVWSRAWDNQLGGGFWWRADKQTKNACVAGPATIAAMLLARNTVNTGYRSQADQIYNWLRSTLYNPSTGQVADHIQANGTKVWWAFTYNQGTFAGASTLLYQATGNASYRDAGGLAVNWTRRNLTGQHLADILNDEYDANGGSGDTAGFKGIFVRWASKWAGAANDASIKSWLSTNANTAWSYRNSSGVMWGQWWRRTPDNYVTSWEASPGLAVSQIPY